MELVNYESRMGVPAVALDDWYRSERDAYVALSAVMFCLASPAWGRVSAT